jgi:hypothetical protein
MQDFRTYKTYHETKSIYPDVNQKHKHKHMGEENKRRIWQPMCGLRARQLRLELATKWILEFVEIEASDQHATHLEPDIRSFVDTWKYPHMCIVAN